LKGRLAAARLRRHARGPGRQARGSFDDEQLQGLAVDHTVDARGTFCPEPVIRTQKQVASMTAGEVLELLADDAGVEIDIPAWCTSTGNEYLGVIKETDVFRVFVRRV